MEAPRGLQIVQAVDENMMNKVEECIRSGTPLLIEGVSETLDPTLEPLLTRNVYLYSKSK